MRILILGGTQFLGRHITDAALAQGHSITLFNRGQRNLELVPKVEKLRGDRNGDMSALVGHSFDAVIDCSGYTPAQIRSTAAALGPSVPHYTFVSSVSAYGKRPPYEPFDESTPLASGEQGYGEEKARAEEAIEAAYPGRTIRVRPGLIVGPHDPTGRFVYWPMRYQRGGKVLAPGRPERPVQWIDARDLAEWIVRCAEQRIVGAFNAITEARANTMQDLLNACAATSANGCSTRWIDDATLIRHEVAPWSELPLWIPENDPDVGGLLLARADRAIAAGLTFRSTHTTVRDALDWVQTLPADHPARGIEKTLSFDREQALLRAIIDN